MTYPGLISNSQVFSKKFEIFSSFSKSSFSIIVEKLTFTIQFFNHLTASFLVTICSFFSGSNKTKCSSDLINGFDILKIFLGFFLIFATQIIYITDVYASSDLNFNIFLAEREKEWPEWNLPNFKSSDLKKDLIYPNWFEGNWLITSQDLNDISQEPITYKVNFLKNQFGEIIGNRKQNSEAIGREIFGSKLKEVKLDPQSVNNQIIYLSDNEYIESRVTGRNQYQDPNLFFADEFVIQTFHKQGVLRVNQVETMSKFYQCKDDLNTKYSDKPNICGVQYQATYGSKVGDINLKAIKTNIFKLSFKFIGN